MAPDYPHNSPYAFSENRVIDGVELEGLEYASVKDLDVDLESSKNNDGSYSFQLDDQAFDNLILETIDGVGYFDLGQDMYYGKNGWSNSGRKKDKMTGHVKPSTTYTISEFEDIWNDKFGRPLTENEMKTLSKGCIGVTSCFIGTDKNPELNLSYDTYSGALAPPAGARLYRVPRL